MIFDCFTYFNEYELLDVRINTLAPYVDAFVLCEANRTFQGAEREYVFDGCYDSAFHTGKPLYVVHADLTNLDKYTDPWAREHYQRRAIRHALGTISVKPEDRIILSDVDEIPKIERSILADIVETPYIIAWKQDLYYYWVNMRCWDWIGSVSCTWHTLREQFDCDLQALRDYRHKADVTIYHGWHFSFLGGPTAIKNKIEAFSHTEYKHFADLDHIEHALTEDWKYNRDLFGRDNLGMKFELMPDDSHLPSYLVANKERFKHWWYPNGAETE